MQLHKRTFTHTHTPEQFTTSLECWAEIVRRTRTRRTTTANPQARQLQSACAESCCCCTIDVDTFVLDNHRITTPLTPLTLRSLPGRAGDSRRHQRGNGVRSEFFCRPIVKWQLLRLHLCVYLFCVCVLQLGRSQFVFEQRSRDQRSLKMAHSRTHTHTRKTRWLADGRRRVVVVVVR